MFAQRRARRSLARITRALNDAGIPCPSAADPGRNAHRAGQAWTLSTVRAILANPRYTGRQVWNRQPTAMDLIDPANTGLGHRQVQRWALPDGWVISARPAHPALVSEDDFVAVQGIRAQRDTANTAGRRYLLAGLLRCGICGRRLESCWANNRPAYRCRHGHTSATARDPTRPKNLYIREDRILPAPACPACRPGRFATRHGTPKAPHPTRDRRLASGQRGRRDQLPAVPADHPYLPSASRDLAGRHAGGRDDRNQPRKLTPRDSAPREPNQRRGEGGNSPS
jgi:hypothetical protein